tara:strand:+ start:672 stop:2570 length:1899 start_codon:yes stop_codon:yes gene_type:complete
MNELITNGTEIKQRIISEINKAEYSVKIAMAYFTDRDIARAIVEAKNNGVDVDVILSSNSQNETVKSILEDAGVCIDVFDTGDTRGIMHHKFSLIDNKISINGSYNYSFNASTNNVENVQISDDLSTYNQFNSEFEGLKIKIKNNMNTTDNIILKNTVIKPKQPINIIESFSKQLNDLVYSSTKINNSEYNIRGYEDSKKNNGDINIFRTEYNNIKHEIIKYATDESLGNIKSKLSADISLSYQSTKTNLEVEKEEKIVFEKRNHELEKKQINDKILKTKEEKVLLESGNQNIKEKGIFQINTEIEKNILEKRILEQSVIVRKFWSIKAVIFLLLFTIFILYLSNFFSSALYKVFLEPNLIRDLVQTGTTPPLPLIIDPNAVIKIFNSQGTLFGVISALFFLVPLILSNLKHFGGNNKTINTLMFWLGILVFDIVVSIVVATSINEIEILINGGGQTIEIWEVFKMGEFWLIFMFGMLPLIVMHYLIDSLVKIYNNSKIEILNAEKSRKIQILDKDMIMLSSQKETLTNKLKLSNDNLNECYERISFLETELNNNQNKIEKSNNELLRQVKTIFDDYSSRIKSGIIFSEVIFNSVISSYKSGFIKFLPELYASKEVSERVKEIEQTSSTLTL